MPLIAALVLSAVSYSASAATNRCVRRAVLEHQALPADKLANWEPLSDVAVLIWTTTSSRAYLVRLAHPFDGLTRASIITLVARDGDAVISACGRDALALGRGDDGEMIRIASIHRLSEKQTRELEQPASEPETSMISI